MAALLRSLSDRYEPVPRFWHTSSQMGSKVLIYSGATREVSEQTKQRLSSVVEVFDPYTELWQQKEVTGEAPAPGVRGVASASVDDDLFAFGGSDGSRFYNSLHRLKDASTWFELSPQNEKAESPMAKSGARMLAIGENLAVFGGYGIPYGPLQPGSSFIKDTTAIHGGGWTNELHLYNFSEGIRICCSMFFCLL